MKIAIGIGLPHGRAGGGVVPPGPINTVAPVLTNAGIGEIGDTLFVTNGTWTTLGTITSATYSWRRNGVSFGAPNAASYVLVAADDDLSITRRVTCTDEFGSRGRTSNSVGPYDLVPAPSVSGSILDGSNSAITDGTNNLIYS